MGLKIEMGDNGTVMGSVSFSNDTNLETIPLVKAA